MLLGFMLDLQFSFVARMRCFPVPILCVPELPVLDRIGYYPSVRKFAVFVWPAACSLSTAFCGKEFRFQAYYYVPSLFRLINSVLAVQILFFWSASNAHKRTGNAITFVRCDIRAEIFTPVSLNSTQYLCRFR